jgi:hypothetical protein
MPGRNRVGGLAAEMMVRYQYPELFVEHVTQFPEGRSLGKEVRAEMNEKQVRLPGPDHPISIQRDPARLGLETVFEFLRIEHAT